MQSKMERMEAIDGFSEWRQLELAALTSEVQSAIDCSKAKKLVCHMNHNDMWARVPAPPHCLLPASSSGHG